MKIDNYKNGLLSMPTKEIDEEIAKLHINMIANLQSHSKWKAFNELKSLCYSELTSREEETMEDILSSSY